MAPAAEDVLGELYAWDSIVEDDFALPQGDPKRDEDKTEDAYEQIIHTASGDASDIVLSLAAQLLHKHFFRFPHVQLNVVDVLLQLCGPARSQAVRIHTLRALLQIVKTPHAAAAASTPTSATAIARKNTRSWLQRINEAVEDMLESEKSSVILRQVTPLRQALEERLQVDPLVASDAQKNKPKSADSEPSSPERSRKKTRDETDAANEAVAEREPKKAKHDEYQSSTPKPEGTIIKLTRDSNDESWKKQALNGRLVETEGRRQKVNAFSPRNCPPCPYLFLGSVPRHTPNGEIVDFLSPVWPEIDSMAVQIKQPDYNATAYAFVSMPTVEHAREAIHYVAANKFRGRVFLNANFARGPPVDTVLFVEKTSEDVSMEDKGAVREFDFSKCDPEVWDAMCQQLERFGPLSYAEMGCVRFRNVEHAKAVIRKQLFTVKGYEIFPVYDTKEQFAIDSTRRGSNVHNKQGFTLKSGRFVGGNAEYRGSKSRHYKEDDPMDGRREHGRVASLKYGDRSGSTRSRSPPRSDRGSARGRSRSPKAHNGAGRYDAPMVGPPSDRRLLHSRSRSPVILAKQIQHETGYGTPSDKENRREYRGKYSRRSPSPMEVRHDSPVRVEELRGRPREREGPWMDARDRREPREEGRSRGSYHRGSPSPSSPSRRSRKEGAEKLRSSDYRRGGGPIDDSRPSYRREEVLFEERGRMPPPRLPGGALELPRSHSRSPPRFGKYAGGSSKSRPRSRSRSPHHDVRMESSDPMLSRYRGRDDRSLGNPLSEERQSFQTERPRYADDRSIAEVARDEQQERQRFFQQQQQGRREFNDGGGRGGRGGRGRGDRFNGQPPIRGGRGGGMYRQEMQPQRRSPSPLPSPTQHRSRSPPLQPRRRSPSPVPPPQQQRESYGRERRGEFAPAPRGREAAYSPPPSPLLQGNYGPGPTGPSDPHEFEPEVADRADHESSRHERRHHSRRDRSRDEKGHRSHREHREKRSSRPERSLTPSPVRRDHASASSGRKSSGPSPRRSFNRRNEGDNQDEEKTAAGKEKQPRSKKEDEPEPQQKEMKNGGARLARDELFAGMDDLTVDYEEDDE